MMLYKSLEISIEFVDKFTVLVLDGIIDKNHVFELSSNLDILISEGNTQIIIDLKGIRNFATGTATSFVQLYNVVKEKEAVLNIIVSSNQMETFKDYRKVLPLHLNIDSIKPLTFSAKLKRYFKRLNKKTGVRLSPSAAVVIFFLLLALIGSFVFIIDMQRKALKEQKALILQSTEKKKETLKKIKQVQETIQKDTTNLTQKSSDKESPKETKKKSDTEKKESDKKKTTTDNKEAKNKPKPINSTKPDSTVKAESSKK